MRSKTVVEKKKIEETIRNTPLDSFTVFDFTAVLRKIYPGDWKTLVQKFGMGFVLMHVHLGRVDTRTS